MVCAIGPQTFST